MIRIFAYVLRFLNNKFCINETHSGPLSKIERDSAKKKLIVLEQKAYFHDEYVKLQNGKSISKNSKLFILDPFLDDENIMRVKGRLTNSSLPFETRHPIILPKSHLSKLIIRWYHLLMYHSGVETLFSNLRSEYWIIGCRKLCKSIIRECVACKRQDSRPCSQVVAPLPRPRVTPAPPFSVIGLDYAGPIFCADFPKDKLYILLLTCATTRAIHLELTNSMKVTDTMLAIRRFVSRRGIPCLIYSDNAKSFKSCKEQLELHYGINAPDWKFISPLSPHQGGYWERLVRSVKSCLKKSLGIKYLVKAELETVLIEIESCINSRPLTYVIDDIKSSVLTPANFIIGRSTFLQPSFETDPTNISANDLYEKLILKSALVNKFWSLWSKLYITNLPHIVKKFTNSCNLRKGSVVLLRDENLPRLMWPLGIIVEVYPGSDGLIRNVRVKTAKGCYTRSIQKLHDLEIVSDIYDNSSVSDIVEENSQEGEVLQTRSGRVVKAPVRLNQ